MWARQRWRSATERRSRTARGGEVGVAGRDGLPDVAVWVGRLVGLAEGFQDPGTAVLLVFGQGLVGPLAGDQDAASGVAEVFGLVRLAPAPAGSHARLGVLGLDAVAQPVRAGRASRVRSAAPRPSGRRARAGPGRRGRGCRRWTWSGTWTGSGCTGRRPECRPGRLERRPGRRSGARAGVRPSSSVSSWSRASSQVGSTSPRRVRRAGPGNGTWSNPGTAPGLDPTRSPGWLRYRRLVRIYERKPEHHEAMIWWATVHQMTRRLTRELAGRPPPSRWGDPPPLRTCPAPTGAARSWNSWPLSPGGHGRERTGRHPRDRERQQLPRPTVPMVPPGLHQQDRTSPLRTHAREHLSLRQQALTGDPQVLDRFVQFAEVRGHGVNLRLGLLDLAGQGPLAGVDLVQQPRAGVRLLCIWPGHVDRHDGAGARVSRLRLAVASGSLITLTCCRTARLGADARC